MPTLNQAPASASQPSSQCNGNSNAATAPTDTAADTSAASQASIFGTSKRRNGQDQPIGAATVGTAYDFSKYLDGELDPFNRASRANPRRESRPLPAQQVVDDDESETSGDTTARGGLTAPPKIASTAATTMSVPASAPIESTPLISRVKAASAATPRMSPHASPSIASRNLAHLSSLSNGHAAASSSSATPNAHADASTASIASHSRFDPSARTDRLQTMEMSELRKKHNTLVRELAAAQDALASAKEESEGWASECTGLQEQLTSLKTTHQAAVAREARARAELQVRLSQYKIEADDRAWKLLSQRRQGCLIDVALQHAKNEATYHEGRYYATESELEGQKDELRIRLMLERKRADLLSLHVKAAMRDGVRLKKKLGAKSAALLELQSENEKLAEHLEEAQHSRRSNGAADGQAAELRQQLEEAQAEIEALNERDAMMAETRKTWKAERKQLLTQIEELTSAAASKPTQPAEPVRPTTKVSKLSSTSQMLPPSSPVYAKKKSRQPMQGASELGPLSEDEDDRRVVGALTAARKASAAKAASPLVPFAQISARASTKAAPAPAPVKKVVKPAKASTSSKTKPSKNWRDEVAITDSSEEDSDNGHRKKGRGHRAAAASDSEDDSDDGSRAKTKTKKKSATSKPSKSNGANPSRPKSILSRKPQLAMPIEYDDMTADPSATPIIRSNKRSNIVDEDSDDDQPADSSVLGAKFGRDRTNHTLAATSKLKGAKLNKTSAATSTAASGADGQVKKKKRKLLGGAGAMQWGAGGGDGANDVAGLAPNFDIPLALSPIKGGAAGGGRGGAAGAALMAGFGIPARNPFA